MRDAISAEHKEASEAGDPGSQAPATSEGDASRTQVLMYAALLAHEGHDVSEARIVSILGEVKDVIQFTRPEVQKLVAALDEIDIVEAIKLVPILDTSYQCPDAEPEPEPEPMKPKPEPEEEKSGFDLLFG